MAYALIIDDQVAQYPYTVNQFREENPDISLPLQPTEAQLNEQGIYNVYQTPQPSYDWITQNISYGTPEKKDGLWYQTWVVTDASPAEIEVRSAESMAENKAYGVQLLQDTDWTAIASIADPLESNPYLANRQAFLEYRNQVRIIVLNPPVGTPNWPVLPQEDWQSA